MASFKSCQVSFVSIVIVVGIYIVPVSSILAFDCGGPSINISTFDLLDTGKCDTGDSPIRTSNTSIQLIQLKRWDHIHVYHCKINVLRTIHHCGMHSHVSIVHNGLLQYVLPISKSQCLSIHRTSSWSPSGNIIIDGLVSNASYSRSTTLAGTVDANGVCTGGSYADSTGSWANVVVQVSYQISIYDQEVSYDIDNGVIKFPSGSSCANNGLECIDSDKGYTYWTSVYEQDCTNTRHHVLYEGNAVRMEEYGEEATNSKNIIYTVQEEGFSFTFVVKSRSSICGISLYTTDHPRLLIHNPSDGIFYFEKSKIETGDMDMFAYINSKFVYVEQHMKSQLITLYKNTMTHKCALEQQTIHNLMNLAISDPELFAYSYMKTPGYTAVRAGEVIHVIKCLPVEVTVRPVTRCYNDLPVLHNNQSKFMTPRNHLLVSRGTEIPCTPLVYPSYKLQGNWFEMSPQVHDISPPQQISISKGMKWNYKSPYQLAISGIYSSDDIDRLRDHIMFPMEKQAITNIIAQGVNNMNPDLQKLSIVGLMDQGTIDKLAQGYLEKMWGVFVWIGNAVSGIMGLWLTWKIMCFCWNTIIHGLSLYKTFGISLHLLTAVSGSLSHYFLHKHSGKVRNNKNSEHNDPVQSPPLEEIQQPLTDVSSSHPTAPIDHIIVDHSHYPVISTSHMKYTNDV